MTGFVIAHYCGNRMAVDSSRAGLVAEQEEHVASAIADALDSLDVQAAFGSLASGADILTAEALLKRGAELHVVLPFGPRRFKTEIVMPGGEGWEARFDYAVRRATSIEVLPGEVEPTMMALTNCARRAMDRAMMRAGMMSTEPVQIAVWDGKPPTDGSYVDVQIDEWQSSGLHSCIIQPEWSTVREKLG